MISGANIINQNMPNSPGSSQVTSSVTLIANNLNVFSISSRATGGANAPTVTGAGVTWTQFLTFSFAGSGGAGNQRITLFRALSATPGSGALTIDWGGQTQDGVGGWTLDDFSGIDTGGSNGANAIVQTATTSVNGSSTGLSATLGAFQRPANGTFGFFGNDQTLAIASGAAFTTLGIGFGIRSEWAANNQTSVNFTWPSTSVQGGLAAFEIGAFAATVNFLRIPRRIRVPGSITGL